jgi:hypothetical protein
MGFTSPEEIGPPTRQFKYYFNLDIKVPHPENCQLTIKMKLSVHGILFALGLCTVTTAGVQIHIQFAAAKKAKNRLK